VFKTGNCARDAERKVVDVYRPQQSGSDAEFEVKKTNR
jgi:hypothetical protein